LSITYAVLHDVTIMSTHAYIHMPTHTCMYTHVHTHACTHAWLYVTVWHSHHSIR